jgi:hypothetical protein
MNEQNFDKFLGDKLKTERDFPFTEQNWDKMENKLENTVFKHRNQQLLFWLLLPLLFLTGLLGWIGSSWHQTQIDLKKLTHEIAQLRALNPINKTFSFDSIGVTKHDTIFHHIIIRRYDTIFQTVVRRDLSNNHSYLDDFSRSIGTTLLNHPPIISKIVDNQRHYEYDKKLIDTIITRPFPVVETILQQVPKTTVVETIHPQVPKRLVDETIHPQTMKQPSNTVVMIPKDTLDKHILIPNNLQINDNQFVTIDSFDLKPKKEAVIDSTILATQQPIAPKKPFETPLKEDNEIKKAIPFIKPIKIEGYEFGISGGGATIDGKNILRQTGFSIGAQGNILLGEHFKMVGETQYIALSYEVEKINKAYDIPIITAPSVNDSFQEVKVKQPYWHYSIGFQYHLNDKKFKPFVGLSLLAQSKLEEKFEYLFHNNRTGEATFVQTTRNEPSFQLPFLRFHLGAHYPIFGKWKAQMESSYDLKLNPNQSLKPLWQLKGTFLYHF